MSSDKQSLRPLGGIGLGIVLIALVAPPSLQSQTNYLPGRRTVNDAHNCYPYDGRWSDRIERALSTGIPVAIEQDLNWYVPASGGAGRVVVGHGSQHTAITHGGPLTGAEPAFDQYFFGHIRPEVEQAIANPDHSAWPIITLNLDFKSENPLLLQAVWRILEKYKPWLTTAVKSADGSEQPLRVGPVLVLNGPFDEQQRVFYDEIPVGGELLTFGAVHTNMKEPSAEPKVIESERVSNYRRWWNNPWTVVESEGQQKAGNWDITEQSRLKALVDHAHAQGLWIRFYTLDGATASQLEENGWFRQYNFQSFAAAKERWVSSIADGVDFLASDEYEQLGLLVHKEE